MTTNSTSTQQAKSSVSQGSVSKSRVPRSTVPRRSALQDSVPKSNAPDNNLARGKGSANDKADRPMVSTGNPRVTVAFPFSKIDIREPSDALRDLAVLIDKLAQQTAAIVSQAVPDQAEAADRLAAEAALLAHRLGAS